MLNRDRSTAEADASIWTTSIPYHGRKQNLCFSLSTSRSVDGGRGEVANKDDWHKLLPHDVETGSYGVK